MKKRTIKIMLLAAVVSLGFFSCKRSSSNNTSRATGWRIDGKDGGFTANTKFKDQETAPGLVFVEGGTFTMGKTQDDPMHDWNNTPNQQHVQSFYMDETEVTNLMYTEYLYWTKSVFPPEDENYKNIYTGVLPDTLVWRDRLGFNETMTTNYLRHPGYADYPVVGVNWIQAVQFCQWRTDRVNESVLEREGYIAKGVKTDSIDAGSTFSTEAYLTRPKETYAGKIDDYQGRIAEKSKKKKKKGEDDEDGEEEESTNVYAKRTTGIILPEYRLPTEAEWEYAAKGLDGLREYNNVRGRKKYPWKGEFTRSGNRKRRGDQLANFKQGKGDYGGIAGWSDDGADITARVKTYPPNDHGLYDMAGNVAEWVADVYRPIVDDEANDFNYYRGNYYTKNKINAEGTVEIVEAGSMKYDTLANGRIMARNLPGQLAQVDVDEKETYLRTNFDKSDNRNYRDGDVASSRYFDLFNEDEDSESEAKRMYNAPKHQVGSDSTGMVRQYDKSNSRTTLIDDNVRVYKGGSWKDRAYWIDPAQRRAFPEYMATSYIGFRCAMSRVGSKSQSNKRPRK
ncbi:gliding motility lipoprotein GldJ [Kordia sp. YSTF-M3]|uniref:Gliding motility lipoprotein GldJ n=1 Tax=Kordia aestuariivivens TaxID=2759037 RepID=A0ABR7QAT7_9FLAO|nr:gliding motility lipoprotein GldJ [Kordia aestuariivivens]MBC8755685.1 gliding motility lipoprotein GldJ [Kordia aestuariivivens]